MVKKEDRERLARYRKEHIKRVPLDMRIERYERLKAHAQMSGIPVNQYIKEAIDARIDREDKKLGIDSNTIIRVNENGKVEYFRRFSVNSGEN